MTYDKELGKIPNDPKHGQIDPTGAPHMGGNTFAGGSGMALNPIHPSSSSSSSSLSSSCILFLDTPFAVACDAMDPVNMAVVLSVNLLSITVGEMVLCLLI